MKIEEKPCGHIKTTRDVKNPRKWEGKKGSLLIAECACCGTTVCVRKVKK